MKPRYEANPSCQSFRTGGESSGLTIRPRGSEEDQPHLAASIHPTKVVHSYSSTHREFAHIRYDTAERISATTMDFVMSW